MTGHLWIIGGGQLQVPVVEVAKELGLSTIVSDRDKNCLCASLADQFLEVDTFDIPAHIDLANWLKNDHGIDIVGVIAAGIDANETASALTKHIFDKTWQFRCCSPEIAHIVHNKHLFREMQGKLGYPVPEVWFPIKGDVSVGHWHIINTLTDKFDVIVKNTDNSASRGNSVIMDWVDMEGAEAVVKKAQEASKSGVALVETMWEGTEHTVETLFDRDGAFHPCFITDRIFDTDSYPTPIEIGLRSPSALPIQIQRKMYQLAWEFASDLGIRAGAAKYDMMVTSTGPRILEMTTRLSGGYDCQYLVPAASGKQVIKAAILVACGQRFSPNLLEDTKKRVAISESMFPPEGTIKDIKVMPQKVKGLEHIFWRANVGDKIKYTDCGSRVNWIITSGKTEKEARKAMEKMKKYIRITVK